MCSPFDVDRRCCGGRAYTVTILNHQFKVSGVVEHGQGARMYISMENLSKVTGSAIRAGVFYVKLQNADQVKAVIVEIDQLWPGYTVRDMVALASLMTR